MRGKGMSALTSTFFILMTETGETPVLLVICDFFAIRRAMPPPQITLYHRGFVRERKLSARPDWRAGPLTNIASDTGGREAARACRLEACATDPNLATCLFQKL